MPLSAVMNSHRMATYALFSSILVGLVVINGFRKHSNFYSIAVYLSRSNGSVLVSVHACVRFAEGLEIDRRVMRRHYDVDCNAGSFHRRWPTSVSS